MAKLIIEEKFKQSHSIKLDQYGYKLDHRVSDEHLKLYRHSSGKIVGIMPNGAYTPHKLPSFFHVNNENEASDIMKVKTHTLDQLHKSLIKHHDGAYGKSNY